MKLTLHLKQLRCHTFPKVPTKAPSRGKEDVILSKVDVVDTLVPALELEPEVAVEDCLDERDIAINCLKLIHRHGPSV